MRKVIDQSDVFPSTGTSSTGKSYPRRFFDRHFIGWSFILDPHRRFQFQSCTLER